MEEFKLDSKGICFICLKESVARTVVKRFHPNFFQKLSQHLKLDLLNILNEVKTTGDLDGMSGIPKADVVVVPLCLDCATVAKKFLKLYERKDVSFKNMQVCLRTMHQLMTQGEKVSCRVIAWKKKMNVDTSPSPKDIFHFRTMKMLRRTTKKCLLESLEAMKLKEQGASPVTEDPVTMPEPTPKTNAEKSAREATEDISAELTPKTNVEKSVQEATEDILAELTPKTNAEKSVQEATEQEISAGVFMDRLSRKRNYEESDGCFRLGSLRALMDTGKVKKETTSDPDSAMFKVPKMRVKPVSSSTADHVKFKDSKTEACPADDHQNTDQSSTQQFLLTDIKKEPSPPSIGSED